MTYSNPYASTSSPTNFIAFSGMGMRKGGRAMLMPSNYQGDGSTLSLDFTTGVLDPRLTFTRSTTATYINSSGYVTTMGAAPTNDPTKARFDYSPTNIGQPRGLLVEGQTTNVANNSNALANAGGLTRTYPTGVISPDGTENAQRFTKSDATTPRYIYPTTLFTVPASTAYTASIWIKYDGYAFTTQIQSDTAMDWGGAWTAAFVIATGGITVGSRTGICSASTVTPYPNGWYRCTATITTGAAPTGANPRFLIDVVGTTGVSVLVYGLQLEAGSGASSYVPTGASQVTRNADLCYMSDISSLSYSATNGSMFYEGSFSKTNSASYPTRMGFLTAAGGDPAFEIFVNGTTIFGGIRSVSASNEITRTIATNTNYKFATSFNTASSSQVRCSLNGAAVVGSGTSAITATRTPTVFGFTRSGYDLYFPSGTIKTAKYWNTTLNDADLVSKST